MNNLGWLGLFYGTMRQSNTEILDNLQKALDKFDPEEGAKMREVDEFFMGKNSNTEKD